MLLTLTTKHKRVIIQLLAKVCNLHAVIHSFSASQGLLEGHVFLVHL